MESTLKKSRDEEDDWIPIVDQTLAKLILRTLGDDDKEKILRFLAEKPNIVSNVLDICKIPKTSAYRKINSLIDDGFLLPIGFGTGIDGKKVTQYVSAFENLKIKIVKNKIIIKVQIHHAIEDLPSQKLKDFFHNITAN